MKLKHNTHDFSLLTEYDIYLFKEGKHYELHKKLGCHFVNRKGKKGAYFAVYAPNASYLSVVADFNYWDKGASPLICRSDGSGIWEGWIGGVEEYGAYKYFIVNKHTQREQEKIDPFALFFEQPPKTASVIRGHKPLKWTDQKWLNNRKKKTLSNTPIAIYEVHLGSWRHQIQADTNEHRSLTYIEMADSLVSYVQKMDYTHIEFMPITEHPYYLSWGYQSLGFFAPTSRYGSIEDFAYLINAFHRQGIGVILDFVPSHFPCDEHGLFEYDGGNIFEYEDPLKQIHPDWKSAVFNYASPFVRSFLISSALFWIENFHIDGLRIDAVASMLYLDYSRKDGQWRPNHFGGNENLEAIEFLKKLNETVFELHPDIHMIAEESTAWPGVSKPTYLNGLGFNMKWMMGWMHDTLNYLNKDPLFRKHEYRKLIFSFLYFTHENFMLPLSHDEVVHGKGSLIERMPGDYWQKFANLRLLFSYMYFHPGSKISFMGNELAQLNEWNINQSLDWNLLNFENHRGIQKLTKNLNALYKKEKTLFMNQYSLECVDWVINDDPNQSVIAFIRTNASEEILVVGNFTPEPRYTYRIGVNKKGHYTEIFNSDLSKYGGSAVTNHAVTTDAVSSHGREYSLNLTLPPLAFIAFKIVKKSTKRTVTK